jgi:hypothetical protein
MMYPTQTQKCFVLFFLKHLIPEQKVRRVSPVSSIPNQLCDLYTSLNIILNAELYIVHKYLIWMQVYIIKGTQLLELDIT